VITGGESGEDDGWASEDNEDGSKQEKSKSKRARIAHFMGRKKRRGSFRGGREPSVEDGESGSRPQVPAAQEEDVRGRGREAPMSPVHRRLGSDFSGGLTVDSARRVGTRESSPARSVRFQEGGRPSYLKHESQKSG
jgi:hypothetical protein